MAPTTSAAPVFLVLAPVTSNSYPTEDSARTSSISSALSSETAVEVSAPVELVEPVIKERRSSSMSSTSSASRRYLKLGPVHGGGDPTVPDFVEAEEQ